MSDSRSRVRCRPPSHRSASCTARRRRLTWSDPLHLKGAPSCASCQPCAGCDSPPGRSRSGHSRRADLRNEQEHTL